MQRLLSSKADALVLKNADGAVAAMIQSRPGTWLAADVAGLAKVKEHPYIETMRLGGTLCIVGVTTVAGPRRDRAQVFLLKSLDREFCAQLAVNRRSSVAIMLGTDMLVSSLAPGLVPGFFNPRDMASSYRELYDQRMGRNGYNAAFQRLGRLGRRGTGSLSRHVPHHLAVRPEAPGAGPHDSRRLPGRRAPDGAPQSLPLAQYHPTDRRASHRDAEDP